MMKLKCFVVGSNQSVSVSDKPLILNSALNWCHQQVLRYDFSAVVGQMPRSRIRADGKVCYRDTISLLGNMQTAMSRHIRQNGTILTSKCDKLCDEGVAERSRHCKLSTKQKRRTVLVVANELPHDSFISRRVNAHRRSDTETDGQTDGQQKDAEKETDNEENNNRKKTMEKRAESVNNAINLRVSLY